jgi:serine/threonine protein kinase/Tol biopolymer transport system component
VPIQAGQQLLHYRLIETIGKGGMGEVWKAVDTNLGREVAIKILPDQFAQDPERLARFGREARLLASLSHPNLAAVYGLHESDTSTGSPSTPSTGSGQASSGQAVHFLAMELVEGEDLSARLSRGKLPVEDALELTRQVCEAVEAAHDAGVVHRDLKPANVMLTHDGKVKVLDFGLAKALAGDPPPGSGVSASLSPTMTSAGTQAGMILGTAAYMSPEQARGKAVDRRADIWALGCLLFEMLTGRGVFGGETVTDTLAAVVRAEPDWKSLPPETPAAVRRVLRRSLEKDPARRLRDAGDLRLEIDEASAGSGEPDAIATTPAPPNATTSNRWIGLVWALSGAALALIAAWFWLTPPPATRSTPARFEIVAATGETLIDPWSLTISPDGRRIAWVVVDGAHRSIHLRELDGLETLQLPATDGASNPAFSPDGQSIAFYADGKLRRFDLGDRRSIDLCDAIDGAGISWGRDGTIVFNAGWISALSRVSAEGGSPEPVTRLDEQDGEIGHWFPHLLPDNEHVLISRWRTGLDDMSVAVASLDSGDIRDLVPRASFARFVPPDRLLFARAGAVYAVPFDPNSLEISGSPEIFVDGVEQQWSSGNSTWAVSGNGVLAYLPGGLWSTKRTIVRVSRQGSVEPMDIEPGAYLNVAMSPDGKRMAMTEFENGKTNVLIRDLARGVDTRLPMDAVNTFPVWNPDGSEIVFDTARHGPWDIYRWPVDGSSEPEPLVEETPDQIPLAWSPDGRFLLWQEAYAEIRVMDLLGDGSSKTLLSNSNAQGLSISPDSRWVAFDAWVSGQKEVLVRRFPDGVRDYQVSIDGGEFPLWSRDGRELQFRRGDAVLAASIRIVGDEIVAEHPRELFRGDYVNQNDPHEWSYDPTTDELIMIRKGDHELARDRFVVLID